MVVHDMSLEALAIEIVEIGEIGFEGEWTLASGLKSPVYVSGRGFVSWPHTLRHVGLRLVDILERLQFDRLAGIPMAGLSLAQSASREAISVFHDWPVIWPRESKKAHGGRKEIEGRFEAGMMCVGLDNVVTDAGSKIAFRDETLQPHDLRMKDVAVVVDREQGGREKLLEAGIALHSIFTLREVLEYSRVVEKISRDRYDLITRYLVDPLSYADNHQIKQRKDAEAAQMQAGHA